MFMIRELTTVYDDKAVCLTLTVHHINTASLKEHALPMPIVTYDSV
jgi:hypothetical protein